MALDIATIREMEDNHIEMVGNIDVPGGGTSLPLRADEVPAYIQDRAQFAANYFNVAKADYLRWNETSGTPQCGATTTKGTRCQNVVSGGIQRSIKEWLRLDGQLCAVHGGETSDRAWDQRWNGANGR